MSGTKMNNAAARYAGHGGAVVGGYGILASLDREMAGAPPRGTAPHDGMATRGAIVAGLGVAALLAWWCLSGPSPVVAYEPKPMWTVAAPPVPAPVPLTVAEAPAAIVNEASPLLAALNKPSPPAALPARHEVHMAHAAPKPVRRDLVRAPTIRLLPTPPDRDVSLLTALVAYTQGTETSAHDVVELRMADSTETLLQRCGRVGGEEGRLCRVRICSGRAADSACGSD